jgi:transposase-like protein
MKGKAHPDEIRARVVAALLAGCGVMEIAREMNLPHNTISQYRSKIPENQLDELRRKKGARIDDLVYDYLVQNLETLRAQSKAVSDEGYIQKQPAGELATLHGVMADKTVRLLEVATNSAIPARELESGAPAE